MAITGSHVDIRDVIAVRNGVPLLESYLHAPLEEPYSRRDFAYAPLLEAGEFFLLGDLRDDGKDSRNRGPIHGERILGRVE